MYTIYIYTMSTYIHVVAAKSLEFLRVFFASTVGCHTLKKIEKKNIFCTKLLIIRNILNLVLMGCYKLLVYWGGGGAPPIFICENNRKGNKIMRCVDLFFKW